MNSEISASSVNGHCSDGAAADRASALALQDARARWHPIASDEDLPYRHVFHGELLGNELAVWRADDGFINIWENRCLHRGVRLSLGINDGRELKCQYHGWRYANRTAGCTYIPAHPADAPARTITNRTYQCLTRYGLIWSAIEPHGEPQALDVLDSENSFALRGVAVNAPFQTVLELLKGYRFHPAGDSSEEHCRVSVLASDEFSVSLRSEGEDSFATAVFFVQPVNSDRSVIRGVLHKMTDDRTTTLIHHNTKLVRLRDEAERLAAASPRPARLSPSFVKVPEDLSQIAEPPANGRKATLRVQVARKWETAVGIAGFELLPLAGHLPTFQPGAHIDVHMPNGQIRQYSLTNGPGETGSFTIGVKREPDSKGGSACMHEVVRQGDVIAISEPRNNFTLRRDALKSVLIAGGIGITPLLAMAQALQHTELPYEIHYFAQSSDHRAFADRLELLGTNLKPHLGLNADETGQALSGLLAGYSRGTHLYICGPGPMLEATRRLAAASGWPEEVVHFEYFKNTNEIDDSSSFEISLARSALTLQVPAGRTILEVIREAGVDMPSSCEQGACGTCVVGVIEGEPDHQDVYLTNAEKASGSKIMTCVSRAKSKRLVLDI